MNKLPAQDGIPAGLSKSASLNEAGYNLVVRELNMMLFGEPTLWKINTPINK